MCDEFDSGLDSLDSDSEFVDDFSADDLSGTMDETSMLEDDMDSFDSFDEEVSGGDSDVMDIMDDTSVDMGDEVLEEEIGNNTEPILEGPEDIEAEETVGEQIENADAVGEVQENSALDNMAEYMSEHNYGREDFETYSQDPEWQQLNNDLLEADGKEPIEYGEETETSALDNMAEYMSEHNYGREDFETYSQDPEWQQLNNDLLEADGKEPIEYGEETETSALDNMAEYMSAHNYGQEDFETYSQDPEWQQLNNDLLEADGKEPIEYGEEPESITEVPSADENSEVEQSVSDIMDNVEVTDSESLDDFSEELDETHSPESSIEELMDSTDVQENEDELEAESELEPEVEAESEVEPEIEAEPEVEPELEPEVEAEPEAEPELEPEVEAEPEAEPELEPEVEAEPELEPEIIEDTDSYIDIEHNDEFTELLLEERPDLAEMFENGEFYEQGNNEYGFEGTCGETTQANTLNSLLGTNEITENDVLSVAIDKNLCEVDNLDPANSGGTSTEQFMDLYNEMNHQNGDKLDVELFDYEDALSLDDMASRLENGSVLNIAVDSNELWDLPTDITDTAHYTDHWISVTGVDRDVTGNISGFKIIDSGGGEKYLDVDKFERCYYGSSDNPVLDPTCIVVSRKGK
ncbi:hypothetical protein GT731_06515 [Blautia wexlerae]|uniref:hypothetical protein n=1 Tax=Blautia wexlerae TaxID=418240 RepID=UPI00136D27BE|nr:hypothetical protein [Blautia wexlerae]MZT14830.1 hypothetical protein [Blautia wexlerae]MZT33020.1 hypothetical protein [Blautia wexlerae]MZT44901.1 hypothetical protein [Blautia wexlerae]MZT61425.1 hypothetical protein [Blautia wexlerae]